jgi:cytochrome c556
MRTKLLFTQNIFEGLTTGDFTLIKNGIKEVQGITAGEQWVAIDDDLYRKLTEDFKTTIKHLNAAAESGNLDAVALRYYQMSTSCIDCHQHMREAAYEF